MKILKILIINLIVILLIFACAEFYYAKKWYVDSFSYYMFIMKNTMSADKYFDMLFKREEVGGAFTASFRDYLNTDSSKPPIVLMGCSFTWGDGLNENETISYQLAQLTGRPIYNLAGKGWGLGQFLFLSRLDKLYNYIPEPEYLIYVYIEDHKNRLDKFKIEPNVIEFQPKYKVSNGHLLEEKPHFYDKIFVISHFQYNYNYRFDKITDEGIKLYFTEAEKEIHKHWKNTKLAIIIYPIQQDTSQNERKLWKELAKNNYTIIDAKDLTDIDLVSEEYKVDGWHPSGAVWKILLPKIIEILNL